jgi:O-6-methylguanine DNA methyltransferase
MIVIAPSVFALRFTAEARFDKPLPMRKLYRSQVSSPLGELYLYASHEFLCFLAFSPLDIEATGQAEARPERILETTKKELTHYFNGKLKGFTIPLNPSGTPFQQKAWNALRKIPFGETRSYQDQAQMIHHPKATRAIGTANGHNPIPILIPCHRVIRSDGTLGGYSGGIEIKQKLLALESPSGMRHFLPVE